MKMGIQYKNIEGVLIILALLLTTTTLHAIVFDGGGDGTSWEDPLNWDTNSAPTAATPVDIPAGFNVVVSSPGQLCDDMDIFGTLTISAGADLLADDDVHIRSDGILTIDGTFTIIGSLSDALDLVGPNSTLINNGLLDITQPGSLTDNIIETGTDCVIINTGIMQLDNDGDTNYDEGITLLTGTSFDNSGTLEIDMGSSGDIALFLDGTGSSFTNSGIVNIINGGDENIETDDGTTFTNTATGVITLENADFQNLEVDGDMVNDGDITIICTASSSSGVQLITGGSFINNGNMTISGTLNTGSFIEIDDSFTNNGVINITGTSSGRSIDLNNNGALVNSNCGIINAGDRFIELFDAANTIVNDGIFTSSSADPHVNIGTFTNNAQIHSTGGVFNMAPNGLVGAGTILDTPIPATTSLCAVVVPTLGEWGLIILGLLLLNLSVLILLRVQNMKRKSIV